MNQSMYLPALRCAIGDWRYYVTCLRFAEIAARIRFAKEIHDSRSLNEMIQRDLSNRAKGITDYLVNQEQRFFNSIIVGVYGGDPEWLDVELLSTKELAVDNIEADEVDQINRTLGLLHLTGKEELFAIDGQHRVAAIRQATRSHTDLSDEEVCVIFVSHKRTPEGLQRTRRLFSTLNRYAKPVSAGEIISLDEDDAFAIVTRQLLDTHPVLRDERASPAKQRNIPPTDKQSFTLILTVYDVAQALIINKQKEWTKIKLTQLRPPDEVLEQVYEECKQFWDGLVANFSEVQEVEAKSVSDEVAGKYRNSNGGHLLFRPIGLLAFAYAVRYLRDKNLSYEQIFSQLAHLEFQLSCPPWTGLLWNPVSNTMMEVNVARRQVVTWLLLYYSGRQEIGEQLLQKYQQLMGDKEAQLPKMQL